MMVYVSLLRRTYHQKLKFKRFVYRPSLMYVITYIKGGFLLKLTNVLKEFIFDCEVKNYSPKTIKGYRNNSLYLFNYLEERYGIADIEDVTAKQIKELFKFLWANGRKTSYTNGLLKCYRAFFKYACSEEYIADNPCHKVPWGKEEKVIIKTYCNDDIHKMLEA